MLLLVLTRLKVDIDAYALYGIVVYRYISYYSKNDSFHLSIIIIPFVINKDLALEIFIHPGLTKCNSTPMNRIW